MQDLEDKIALVTGAARGIGLEITRSLANRGMHVIATDVDTAALQSAIDDLLADNAAWQISVQTLDVTDAGSWGKVARFVGDNFGALNILVNNAGIMQSKPFAQTSLEDFRRAQTINVDGAFLGIKSLFDLMAKTAKDAGVSGSIINMSSIYGVVGGNLNVAYCASKGALTLMSKALAVEFGHSGANIRVNTVHPGGVDTALGRGGMNAFIETGAAPNVEAVEAMIAMSTPLGRLGQTDDIGGVVAFLASDMSKYITGTGIVVDGGFSAA